MKTRLLFFLFISFFVCFNIVKAYEGDDLFSKREHLKKELELYNVNNNEYNDIITHIVNIDNIYKDSFLHVFMYYDIKEVNMLIDFNSLYKDRLMNLYISALICDLYHECTTVIDILKNGNGMNVLWAMDEIIYKNDIGYKGNELYDKIKTKEISFLIIRIVIASVIERNNDAKAVLEKMVLEADGYYAEYLFEKITTNSYELRNIYYYAGKGNRVFCKKLKYKELANTFGCVSEK